MRYVGSVYIGECSDFEPELLDRGAPIDLSFCAVSFLVRSTDGEHTPRAGKILDPKEDGKYRLFLRGSETAARRDLWVSPIAMIPTHALDPTIRATNLLANASFDTASGTAPTRVATGWSISGTLGSASYDNHDLGPKPATIFGTMQTSAHSGGGSSFLTQTVAISGAPGDYFTFGVWIRANNLGGAVLGTTNAVRLIFGNSADNVTLQLPNTDYDWTFYVLERRLTVAQTTVAIRLVNFGETGEWCYDEACFFAGRYRTVYLDRFRIQVSPTRTIPKTANLLAGYGSFEKDSNSDGLADAWAHGSTWGGVTPTHEKDPANVYERERSQKLAMSSSAAGSYLTHTQRGAFQAGEQYEFSVRAKTSGAMSSAATVELLTQPFVTGGAYESSTPTNVGPDLSSFTKVATTLTLTKDTEALECRLNLGGITSGTLWIDDAQLVKI